MFTYAFTSDELFVLAVLIQQHMGEGEIIFY